MAKTMKQFRAASVVLQFDSLFGKRTKVTLSAALSVILAWITLSLSGSIFTLILILALIVTAGFILWAFSQDLAGLKYLIIPALPVLYLGFYIILVKLLDLQAAGIFAAGVVLGISFYFLLLTQNIYNIAAVRSIGLVRAANVSGTLFHVVTSFLAFGVIWLQSWPFWVLTPTIFATSFILFILAIWSQHLSEISQKDTKLAAFLSLAVAELALSLSFWPLLPLIAALVLAISFYVTLGLVQFELQDRLTTKVVYEYLLIAGVVLVLILATTSWTG